MLFFSFLTALLRRKSPWAVTPRSAHPSSVPCGCLFGSSHSSLVHAPFLITHLREAVISGSRPVCSPPAASSIRYFFFNSDRYVDHYLCMLSSIGSTICLFFFYISADICLLPSIYNDRHLYTPVYRLQLSFIYFLLLVRYHIIYSFLLIQPPSIYATLFLCPLSIYPPLLPRPSSAYPQTNPPAPCCCVRSEPWFVEGLSSECKSFVSFFFSCSVYVVCVLQWTRHSFGGGYNCRGPFLKV